MISLPFDYSRCAGSECAIRQTCARFTSPYGERQPVSDFSLGDTCGHFIDNQGQETARRLLGERHE